jgi:acetyl-CoA carboxylase carboxyl transferase subunit beta
MADPDKKEREGGSRLSRLRFKKKDMPGGLWLKCPSCDATIFRKELVAKGHMCPSCRFHFTVPGPDRIAMILDGDSWHELHAGLTSIDRLSFPDKVPYDEKIARNVEKTGQNEALLCGLGRIQGRPIVLAVLDFKFQGGSMGEVVGEKIALACDEARTRRLPLVIFTSSGGARMQEGVLSLMQMAKTCSALATLNEQGGFSICVMTNPTTGGVTASFASVCDLTLAEPGALIGFAGPRVIASTIRQELPEGFQRSEFLISKGQLDIIVDRDELKDELASLIDYGTTRWEDYPPPLPEPAATSEAEGSASLEEGTPGGEEPGGEEPGDEEPGDEIPGPTQAEEKQVDLDSTEGVEREA